MDYESPEFWEGVQRRMERHRTVIEPLARDRSVDGDQRFFDFYFDEETAAADRLYLSIELQWYRLAAFDQYCLERGWQFNPPWTFWFLGWTSRGGRLISYESIPQQEKDSWGAWGTLADFEYFYIARHGDCPSHAEVMAAVADVRETDLSGEFCFPFHYSLAFRSSLKRILRRSKSLSRITSNRIDDPLQALIEDPNRKATTKLLMILFQSDTPSVHRERVLRELIRRRCGALEQEIAGRLSKLDPKLLLWISFRARYHSLECFNEVPTEATEEQRSLIIAARVWNERKTKSSDDRPSKEVRYALRYLEANYDRMFGGAYLTRANVREIRRVGMRPYLFHRLEPEF